MEKLSKKKELITWHSISAEAAIHKLVSHKNGLDEQEVEERLKRFGPNKLNEEKKQLKSAIFFSQFKNPLIYILLVAAVISFALNEVSDSIVIMLAVIVNTIIGYVEENKADEAMSSIKKLIKTKAKVLRKNKDEIREIEIESTDLVPGDIILLTSGDRIPADARLLEVNELKVNEASLTGESMPVIKKVDKKEAGTPLAERDNMVYMGTIVMNGNGKAIICETGVKTEMGKIALLVSQTAEEKTPLQKQIGKFSKFFTLVVLSLCSLILFIGLIRGIGFLEIFLTAVALAVAAIPEGLVISVTIILAIGMQRILKKNALVKKLVAAETLGGASIICMDKTGTITEGKMMVSHILAGRDIIGQDHDITKSGVKELIAKSPKVIFALEIGMLCNNAVVENPSDELHNWIMHGDPTEGALYLAAVQAGLNKEDLEKKLPKIKEIPFDEEKKYMATFHQKDNKIVAYLKGAPEVLIDIATQLDHNTKLEHITEARRKELKIQYENLSSKGLRVLAVGYKEITQLDEENYKEVKDIIFVGLIGLKDPLRKDAKETIESCLVSGIRPIIITGDHRLTAKAIMQEVGINITSENILEGEKLDKMTDDELQKLIKKIIVYARVSPRHKLRIVDAWQATGEIVAMTGDGVNDAPAIKSADIGIALGSGTDVARETADIILLDDSFKTIVDIIKQGRVIFDNIRKVILYLLADSLSEITIVAGSLLLGLPLPILPAQILWINLANDGFAGIAMAMEPEEKGIEKNPPRPKNEPILNFEMRILIFLIGTITSLILFLFFIYLKRQNADLAYIRTLMFTLLGVDSLFYIFSCRSLKKPFWKINFFSNKILLLAIAFGLLMQISAVYLSPLQHLLKTVPLSFIDWIIVFIFGIINIVAIEIGKRFFI